MNKRRRKLTRQYALTLRRYLEDEQEAILAEAYELGRLAIAQGAGVLDMARVHQQALEKLMLRGGVGDMGALAFRAPGTFFLETLSPFEVTHRGFRETNLQLQQLIATLEQRNVELAGINRELQVEITDRKRKETALRESEGHLQRMFHEASRMEEDLRSLSNQVLRVQEEERKRISRELHDEVSQALVAISMTLAGLKQECASDNGRENGRLAEAERLLQSTMRAVHDFARELRPAILDELGLLPALRSYLKGFSGRTGLAVRFQGNALAERLNDEQKTVLFRVAQESLTNVAKHARASRVAVAVRKTGDRIRMEIADNGRSFGDGAANARKRKTRLGLLGMQERVRLVNGTFVVHARPGRGTTVRVILSFNRDASERLRQPAERRTNRGQSAPRGARGRKAVRSRTTPRKANRYGKNPSAAG
jgi:signal transduction histidine kinase